MQRFVLSATALVIALGAGRAMAERAPRAPSVSLNETPPCESSSQPPVKNPDLRVCEDANRCKACADPPLCNDNCVLRLPEPTPVCLGRRLELSCRDPRISDPSTQNDLVVDGRLKVCLDTPPPSRLLPNIFFIVSDDWGWPFYEDVAAPSLPNGTLSLWSTYFPGSTNDVVTPNLDRLAEAGAFFPLAHGTGSLCLPATASLLSGRYPKDLEPRAGGPIRSRTIAHALKDKYCSVSAGKTWGHDFWDREDASLGRLIGFDVDLSGAFGVDFRKVGRTKSSLESLAYTVRTINVRSGKPFLVWYFPELPHRPLAAPDDLAACYPSPIPALTNRYGVEFEEQAGFRGYRANQSWFDCGVGRLLHFLENTPDERFSDGTKLLDTTLIIYATDNGNFLPQSKYFFSENGYRTAMIFFLRGRIPKLVFQDHPVSTLDALPTALDYAGELTLYPPAAPAREPAEPMPTPEPTPVPAHLGRSLKPLFDAAAQPPRITPSGRSYLFGHLASQNSLAVRGTDARYLRTRTLSPEEALALGCVAAGPFACKYYQSASLGCRESLFNVVSDPDEKQNLLTSSPTYETITDPCRCLFKKHDSVSYTDPEGYRWNLRCQLLQWWREGGQNEECPRLFPGDQYARLCGTP